MKNYLKRKTISCIVHNYNILQLPINDPKILDINALLSLNAAFPEQPVLNQVLLGIEMVEDYIGVTGVTGGEYDNFAVQC